MGSPRLIWHDDWIREHIDSFRTEAEMMHEYNRVFGENIGRSTFHQHIIRKYDFKNEYQMSEEERKFVKDNYHRLGAQRTVEELHRIFGTKRTIGGIRAEAGRRGLYVDADAIEEHKNYPRRVPIGTIVDDGDGYLKIKTGKGSSGWERYHRYLYEKAHGKLKRGMKIMFLDGNKRNYNLDNMVAVPASFFALMNKLKLKSEFPEITKTGIMWCELHETLKSRLVKGEN